MEHSTKKMTPINCDGCPQKITNRQYMTCSVCNCTYDLFCANVSFTRFTIMEKEKKVSWRCTPCISKRPKGDNTNTPVGSHNIVRDAVTNENVTIRRPKSLRRLSLENLSLSSHTIEDSFEDATFCPSSDEVSNASTLKINQLKNELDEITSHLIKAKEEINKLQRENTELKSQVESIKNPINENISVKESREKQISLESDNTQKNKTVMKTTTTLEENFSQTETKKKQKKRNKPETTSTQKRSLSPHEKTSNRKLHKIRPTSSNTNVSIECQVLNTDQKATENIIHANNKKLKTNIQDANVDKSVKMPVACKKNPKIHIVGDQSCKDIAAMIITLRDKNRNAKDYDVLSYSYPNAHTEHILRNSEINNDNFQENDWLVLSLGSNETNPTRFFIEISAILKKITKPNIIVTSVMSNSHLNEDKLNQELRNIVNNSKNSQFLELQNHQTASRYQPLKTAKNNGYRINTLIDTEDYKSCYLGKNITRKYKQTQLITKLKTGTIPYFFDKMNKINAIKNVTKSKFDTTLTNLPNTINDENGNNSPRPGTIPFYFQKKNTPKACTSPKPMQFFLA